MISSNLPASNQNFKQFSEQEKKKELNRLISSLSNSQRQYQQQKNDKNLHHLIDSLVSIDLTLLDFINHYNLNPAQYADKTFKYPLIDLYSVKLFDNIENQEEFHKNICLCYNIIVDHFNNLQEHTNIIFESFSKKIAE